MLGWRGEERGGEGRGGDVGDLGMMNMMNTALDTHLRNCV